MYVMHVIYIATSIYIPTTSPDFLILLLGPHNPLESARLGPDDLGAQMAPEAPPVLVPTDILITPGTRISATPESHGATPPSTWSPPKDGNGCVPLLALARDAVGPRPFRLFAALGV